MQYLKIGMFSLFITCITTSCITVKPYQRVYLNDYEMQMHKNVTEIYEEKVQDIREGASPSGGNIKSSGCGCN